MSKDKQKTAPAPASAQTFTEAFHPSNDRWDFVGKNRLWVGISIVLVSITFLMIPINWKLRGAPLNWGIDFRGGTEMRVELAREVEPGPLREAVESSGYHGADVVAFGGEGKKAYLVRLPQVTTLSPERAKNLEKALGTVAGVSLKRFGFKEGSDKVDLKFEKDVAEAELAGAIKGAGVETLLVRKFGRAEDHAWEITLSGVEKGVTDAIKAKLGADIISQVPSVETVGAKAGKQLRDDGMRSLLYAILLIMVYVAVRFDFRYGPGTVIALLHDALITVLAYELTYREFSLTTLAAILTIIGYSMNDTIVVFDRIRENAARARDKKFEQVVNESINETMSRTVLTSATVFISSAAMWLFGKGVIADFGFAMTVGTVIGAYSSIFIASPALIWLHNKMAASQAARRPGGGKAPPKRAAAQV